MTGRTVVVLRALHLGDLLTGVPALRALRAFFCTERIVLATPAAFAPLVAHAGLADEVSPACGLRPLDRALQRPAVAVDLHGRGPGSQPLLLALDPERLVAFAHPAVPATAGGPEWLPGEHETQRWCRLLWESGIPADPRRLDLEAPRRPVPPWVRGATIIHPGAASEARRWPIERFAAVARAEIARGRRVVITGGSAERSRARRLAAFAHIPNRLVLAGRTDVLDLLAVVAAAGRLVSGDTGVAHVATAVGTPSVVLFGPVSPAEWGPPPDRPWHQALWTGVPGNPHGRSVSRGLLAIEPDHVIAALDALGDRPPSLSSAEEAS